MRDLVFISHRIPWPPDKGEKIRASNLLRHLSRSWRIHLGCLMESDEDAEHLPTLRQWCATVDGFRIDRSRQKWRALAKLRPGRPLMLDYYHHPGLRDWTRTMLATHPGAVPYIYSVAMMPYVDGLHRPGMVLDAQDIDSEKWTTYAAAARPPMRWVWAREGRTLLAYERWAAMQCDATLFVSPQEAGRFAELAPEAAPRLHAIENGVDLARFNPALSFDRPFPGSGPHLVFTGNMDYWPNADAVQWFAADIMPLLRIARPGATFHVVGANPGPDVLRLAGPDIFVTGRVPDVRPYVAHADVAVAPLRIARGIQNKVLEAMALSRPVVASPQAFEGVRAQAGRDLLVADTPEATVAAIGAILDGAYPQLPAAARAAVEAGYAWDATLAPLDAILSGLSSDMPSAARPA